MQPPWVRCMKKSLLTVTLTLAVAFAVSASDQAPLQDKTLVAWVSPANLTQRGGSVLSIDDQQGHFDGIVFGERAPARWMAGSDNFKRTALQQEDLQAETVGPDTFVQMALVYQANEVVAYRNGVEYSRHTIKEPQVFGADSRVLIGPRCLGSKDCFAGEIEDARIYDRALSVGEIAALKPNEEGAIKPWVWWNFEGDSTKDLAGRFPEVVLKDGAKVSNGRLVLDGSAPSMVAGTPPKPVPNDTTPDADALFATLFANPKPERKVSVNEGIGYDDLQHSFQDPSNVIKVGDTYYVWVSWRPLDVHLYNSVIHYATSKDGKKWEQKGLALGKGPEGSWDDWGVLTPYVAEANGRFYMFYTGADRNFLKGSGNAIGLAVADKPEGPWARVFDKPVLAPSGNPKDWDSNINDDAHVIKREGKYWLYYKGHPRGRQWTLTQQGVAIADKIEGPYVKYEGNPVIKSGHCVCVWPHNEGVAAIADIPGEILWAKDGLHFVVVNKEVWRGGAGPGPYDPDAHNDTKSGGGITWGIIQMGDPSADNKGRNVCARFDLDLRAREDSADAPAASVATAPSDGKALNFHLMHPGGYSAPGDPNAAFYLDGVYHLHYILAHPWKGKGSHSYAHVTSPDMLHWTWQPTKLQPSLTGHGMYSGTGFITKEGKAAVIYYGNGSERNQIAIAKDNQLSDWEKPCAMDLRNPDGSASNKWHWDPDCFLIGDTYYAISGGMNPPLFKSQDLKSWTLVGDFLRHDMPDVTVGEDISCGNFFKLGDKWMLLCISHSAGCRYYIGDWDVKAEQFVPQKHGRMNWRREDQNLFGGSHCGELDWRADFFAPESVLTPDNRRVMWAWLATIDGKDGKINNHAIQSLPRELSLPADGVLRIRPLRELETLRYDPATFSDMKIADHGSEVLNAIAPVGQKIATLGGEAAEIRITIARDQAMRKLFGFTLFADGKGGGLPILFRPETGALRVGSTEAPFSVADLPAGEDVELRIFVDKYLVEVFVNDRQAMVASYADYRGKFDLEAFTVRTPITIKSLEIWKLKPTNEGFLEAQKKHVWEPQEN